MRLLLAALLMGGLAGEIGQANSLDGGEVVLPQCLKVHPLSADGVGARRFQVTNGCGQGLTGVAYGVGLEVSDGSRTTRIVVEEFTALTRKGEGWEETLEDSFSGVSKAGARRELRFQASPEERAKGVRGEGLDVFVLAVAYADGKTEGLNEYRKELARLRERGRRHVQDSIQLLTQMEDLSRLGPLCGVTEQEQTEQLRLAGLSTEPDRAYLNVLCGQRHEPERAERYRKNHLRNLEQLAQLYGPAGAQ